MWQHTRTGALATMSQNCCQHTLYCTFHQTLTQLLSSTLPVPTASEVTTLWCYTDAFIIIIIFAGSGKLCCSTCLAGGPSDIRFSQGAGDSYVPAQWPAALAHNCLRQLMSGLLHWNIVGLIFVDVVYFDIAKALDAVSHVKLIYKLRAYGVHGSLLSLIVDFLDGRSQGVKLPGVHPHGSEY